MKINNVGGKSIHSSKIAYLQHEKSKFSSFFNKDSFISIPKESILNNYYSKNDFKTQSSNVPFPTNNCYVEDVKGAGAALEKLKAESDSFDYTGMSDGEIFMSIFERYSAVFGDQFIDYQWQQIMMGYGEIEIDNKNMASAICNQFLDEIHSKVENVKGAFAYYFGYDGMNVDEMKSAIMNEFSTSGKSYASFHKMIFKLERVGAMSSEVASILNSEASEARGWESEFGEEMTLARLYYMRYLKMISGYDHEFSFDWMKKMLDRPREVTGNEDMVKAFWKDLDIAKEFMHELSQM